MKRPQVTRHSEEQHPKLKTEIVNIMAGKYLWGRATRMNREMSKFEQKKISATSRSRSLVPRVKKKILDR